MPSANARQFRAVASRLGFHKTTHTHSKRDNWLDFVGCHSHGRESEILGRESGTCGLRTRKPLIQEVAIFFNDSLQLFKSGFRSSSHDVTPNEIVPDAPNLRVGNEVSESRWDFTGVKPNHGPVLGT